MTYNTPCKLQKNKQCSLVEIDHNLLFQSFSIFSLECQYHFWCTNDNCISTGRLRRPVCDGENDCIDNSDERSCYGKIFHFAQFDLLLILHSTWIKKYTYRLCLLFQPVKMHRMKVHARVRFSYLCNPGREQLMPGEGGYIFSLKVKFFSCRLNLNNFFSNAENIFFFLTVTENKNKIHC